MKKIDKHKTLGRGIHKSRTSAWILAASVALGTGTCAGAQEIRSAAGPVAPAETAALGTSPLLGTLADTGVSSSATVAGENTASLPEAPSSQLQPSTDPQPPTDPQPGPEPQPQNTTATAPSGAQHVVPRHSEYVPAGWTAPRQTAHDKIVAGAEDLYSLENIAAIVISAGYEYVVDSQPNYSPSDAFGKRVGAAAIRETSQGVFTDMVFAPLLHEDTRYFQKGHGHGFIPRTVYAITRPLITRTDNGGQTINGALLLGYAGAAALTPLYYPSINQNFHDTASTFGGSIGGAALGFFVSEFSDDVLQALHLKHPLK